MLLFKILVSITIVASNEIRDARILTFNTTSTPLNKIENFDLNKSYITPNGLQTIENISAYLSILQTQPVAVLVQDRNLVLNDADIYLTAIMKKRNLQSEFWLMKFNSSGVSTVLSRTRNEMEYFKEFLSNNDNTTEYLGLVEESAATFFSILKAVRMLPPGSGILLFTDSKVEDEDLAQLAIRETLNKQIRLFVVWQGMYPTIKKEERLLKEAAFVTHGYFFIGNTERKLINFYPDNTNKKSIITHLTNLSGKRQVKVPIEQGVTSIHLSLSTTIDKAYFISPSGYVIDLLNETSVKMFSKQSFHIIINNMFEIELYTNGDNFETTGIWLLETNAVTPDYSITVSVQNNLILNTKVIQSNNNQGKLNPKQFLRLDLQGDFSAIDNITLINENGREIKNIIDYNINQLEKQDKELDIETFNEKDVDINLENLPHKPVYIQVSGRDKQGNEFVRLSYFNRDLNYKMQSVFVEVGLGSELLPASNQAVNIYFEVTNNKNQVIFVNFLCRDDKRLLRWMQPQWAWLNPRQTIVVSVNIFTRPTAGSNYDDLITFSAISGVEHFSKKVRMTIGPNKQQDLSVPHMWHKFTSNCLNVLLGRCEDATWTLEVTAQDRETGLLQVTSNPPYLYFPQGYTSGTTEEVTGIYSGSCCQSIIQLTAVDLVANRRTYVVDAYRAPLGPGEITAIVLGLLLLIIIIIILVCVFKCGKCRRKESDSLDLQTPSYRGPVNSSSTRRY